MTERPILFSGAMVRAQLTGTKTQTRRVVKPQPTGFVGGPGVTLCDSSPAPLVPMNDFAGTCGQEIICPYGQPGDRLWVRETHYLHGIWSVRKDDDGKRRWTFSPNQDIGVQFDEPNGLIRGRSTTVPGWYRRPSIHMPRWASRITLEITDVRVERLQDISEADAQAEGWTRRPEVSTDPQVHKEAARDWFMDLWESINGPGSWDANPWVWVVEFRRLP